MNRLSQVIVTLICSPMLLLSLITYELAYAYEGSLILAEADTSAQFYWNEAQASDGEERDANLLLTANALLKAHKLDQARDVLKAVKNPNVNAHLAQFKRLVDARYSFIVGNIAQATSRINQVDTKALTRPVLVEYYELKAQINEAAGQSMEAVAARVELDAYLSSRDDFQENNRLIWDTLQHVSPAELDAAMNTSNTALKGWVELARIERKLTAADTSYVTQLEGWRERYRGHPGVDRLPSNPARAAADRYKPSHIALLLPLEGKLAQSGIAVRDGFMAAYYGDAQMSNQTAFKVSVIDTKDDTEIEEAYQRAVAEGATMIVGPLTKQGVDQISSLASRDMTVLALNYSPSKTSSNIIEFGLSPEDEARQAARKAWQDGHRAAVILVQDGEWGKRVSAAFSRQWKSLGGDIIDSRTYKTGDQLSDIVKKILKVNESEARAKKLAADINAQVSSEGRRRQDIDMIFLGAMPGDARQIQPLLAFYYAQDLPVYATASVYGGMPNPSADKDLNGITFCDAPWLIEDKPTSIGNQSTIAKLWPNPTQAQLRLYALGVDAYEIIPLIPRLQNMPDFTFSGATGKLSLSNNEVSRTLRCTKFMDGQPKKLPSSV